MTIGAIGKKSRSFALFVLVTFSGVLLSCFQAFADDPMVLYDAEGLKIRAHLQAGLNGVAEKNLFWNFADNFAPSLDYNPRKQWLEGYVKPGISFNSQLNDGINLYGKGSVVLSGTLGTDAFNVGDTGRLTVEEAYIGFLNKNSSGAAFDLSVGAREFKAGTGMLIANGGTSGFERGALKFGPRKAWKSSAIAQFSYDELQATAFYLQPNELPDSSSNTQLVGADLRYQLPAESFAGVTFGHVLESNSPYVQAAPDGHGAPEIIADGRKGLNVVNVYAIGTPFPDVWENFIAGTEFAYEWNDRIDLSAWAGRVYIGYNFIDLPWQPSLAIAYQSFSGDDPSTARLERFDPLFYEGNPSAWSTGTKSSMVFINSNVSAYQASLRVKPTERDAVSLRYAHIRANELRSPIQFGQGTRVETSGDEPDITAGVTSHHLSDDIYLEYNRILNAHTYLTIGFSVSFPGSGIESAYHGKAPTWTGGFANVVVNF